jgi:tetratricopeptide (TPR) repeat protein
MWGWGLNLLRFVPAIPGWTLWAVAALVLVPAVGRRAERWVLAVLPDDLGRSRLIAFVGAAGAAILVASLPDQTFFVGDFLLRQTALQGRAGSFHALYPQALPLDALLHDTLPRALRASLGLDDATVGRALGAVEAAALALLALRLARVLELRASAGLAVASVLFWSGALALLTGYNKAFAEMALVTAAVGVFGLEAVRRGSGLLAMGVAFALGLLLHRLALALLPAAIVVWLIWRRRHGRDGGWRRRGALVAAANPLAALAALTPGLIRLVVGFDAVNFLSPEVRRAGGVAAALSATRLADLANMLLLMAPLSPLIALAPLVRLTRGRGGEAWTLVALALPLVGFVPFFHPPIGLFRNWDACAPTGVALALAAAWTVGELMRAGPRPAGLGLAVALQALAPGASWLLHHHDAARGLARVEAFVRERPARTELERGSAWDVLGRRYLDLGRSDEALAAFEHAAEATPSPTILREWGTAAAIVGHPEAGRDIYRRLLERKPDDAMGWVEYGGLSFELGDTAEARRAAERALRLAPGLTPALRLLEAVERGGP